MFDLRVPVPTLILLVLAACGSNPTSVGDAPDVARQRAAPDAEEEALCEECLPAGGLSALGDVVVREYPTTAEDECFGVCIGGTCQLQPDPGAPCDKAGKGFAPVALDPDLADEAYVIGDKPKADEPPCDGCTCDGETCEGLGNPFPVKRHRVFLPEDGELRDELFVFLGGTGGRCSNHKWIPAIAATAGYRAICLGYINDPGSSSYCQAEGQADPETPCFGEVRNEMVFGEDTSSELQIGPRNAVQGRLAALLAALASNAPTLGFDAFLDGDTPRWDRIVMAGYSQGGGNVGWLAGQRLLARAIYYSTPLSSNPTLSAIACTDHSECQDAGEEACVEGPSVCATLEPAPWYTLERATPPERELGFVHEGEGAWHFSPDVFTAWGLDACGGFVSADNASTDFGCSRLLSTAAPPEGEADEHGSMGGDSAMAKDADGLPVNQRAMTYLVTAHW